MRLILLFALPGLALAAQEPAWEVAAGPGPAARRLLRGPGLTTRFVVGPEELPVHDEGFRLWLRGRAAPVTLADLEAAGPPARDGAGTLVFALRGRGELAPLRAAVSFAGDPKLPLFRKWIDLAWEGPAAPPLAAAVEVERLRLCRSRPEGGRGGPDALPLSGGKEAGSRDLRRGTGVPLYAGDLFFMGLEHPAGWNLDAGAGLAVLRHHPERPLPLRGPAAAIGAAGGDGARLAFRRYLDGIRRRPPAPFPHYNSWYDLRGEMTAARLLAAARAFREQGIPLACLAVDDGWQEPRSIWQAQAARFPGGLAPLARGLEGLGTRLGLWLPLTGFNLDTEWGARQGYEVAGRGRYYLLQGPRYRAELEARIRHFLGECRVNYLKMDFNYQLDEARTPGELERAVDETLAALELMARLAPEAVLNLTSFVHRSPWWLAGSDFAWLGGGDHGYDGEIVAVRRRDRALTYRDGVIFREIRERSPDFPLNALMVHGIIHGRFEQCGGEDETADSFLDACIMHLARGSMLQELYVSPDTMTAPKWAALRESLLWGGREAALLAGSDNFLGDARRGEVTGYRAARGGEALAALRNPNLEERRVELAPRTLFAFGGAAPERVAAAVVYPRRRRLEPGPAAAPRTIRLGPHEVALLRFWPEGEEPAEVRGWPAEAAGPDAPEGRLRAAGDGSAGLVLTAVPKAGTRLRLVYAERRGGGGRRAPAVEVAGRAAALSPVGDHSLWWTGVMELAGPPPLRVGIRPAAPILGGAVSYRVFLLADQEARSPGVDGAAGREGDGPVLPGAGPFPPVLAASSQGAGTGPLAGELVYPEPLASWPAGVPRRPDQAAGLYLVLDLFGSDRRLRKEILAEGRAVAALPPNEGELDAWETALISLPGELLPAALAGGLEVRIRNAGGDYLKLRRPGLAVRLRDGRLVLGPREEGVWHTVAGWVHAEGEPFAAGLGPPWRLGL